MAFNVRNDDNSIQYATIKALNLNKALQVGTSFHYDATSLTTGGFDAPTVATLTVSAANATDLPTCITLANNIQIVGQIMMKDGVSTNTYSAGAHKVPDVTNNTASPTAADLPTVIALANAWKAQFNVHIASTVYHPTADATNTIIAANATILADSITLLNAMKTAFNAHIASAPAGQMVGILGA